MQGPRQEPRLLNGIVELPLDNPLLLPVFVGRFLPLFAIHTMLFLPEKRHAIL
jgi:hypothetical protein